MAWRKPEPERDEDHAQAYGAGDPVQQAYTYADPPPLSSPAKDVASSSNTLELLHTILDLEAKRFQAAESRDLLQKDMTAQLQELRALRALERAVRGVVMFRDALMHELADVNDARKVNR